MYYDFCVGFDEDGLPPARRELAGGGRGRARERESDFLDPRRLTGLIEDRFGRHAPPAAAAGQSYCDGNGPFMRQPVHTGSRTSASRQKSSM
jgi:hypothetical protein